MTLQAIRKAHAMTQEQLSKALNMDQGNLSRMEKRSDLLISTLRSYIKAMGGDLHLVAEFPGKKSVEISGLADFTGPEEERLA